MFSRRSLPRHSLGPAFLFVFTLAFAQAQTAPQTFKVTPMRPIAELRAEALKAAPAEEHGNFRATDLVELAKLDPTIKLDIHYASTNNFLGEPVYTQARAFLQRPAAEALVRANQKLHALGLGLLVFDGYRPWYVTRIFWDATPPSMHDYVADPAQGSKHNRGCAVDLTLYDLKTGQPLPMPSAYDEMSERAHPDYRGGTADERATVNCCAMRWRRKASQFTNSSGGTSTTRTGSTTVSRTCRSKGCNSVLQTRAGALTTKEGGACETRPRFPMHRCLLHAICCALILT